MQTLPDFERHGYRLIRELGRNFQGGRITYQAIHIRTQIPVVVKQFLFAMSGNDWSSFKAYEREIQVLRDLNHPGIPCYLDSFETASGFCMVQEYKNAQPLSTPRTFDPNDVKQIAIKVLEILVYLQKRIPPVIHRDLKPENVLVDDELNVYLVDFGFARIGGGDVTAMSSMVAGTAGFMPPEQMLNRPLTLASDLYGLGAMLVCLLTGTTSTALTNLIDSNYRIAFRGLVPQLNQRFIEWLETLVQPNHTERFPNAEVALETLKPLYVICIPETQLSPSMLELKASHVGEILTTMVTITNPVPDTMLEGVWEVSPHHSDPPAVLASHAWISISPAQFVGNQINCTVTVDTHRLLVDQVYERQLILKTNSSPSLQTLTLKIYTAPPLAIQTIPYAPLGMVGIFAGLVAAAGTSSLIAALALHDVALLIGGAYLGFILVFVSGVTAIGIAKSIKYGESNIHFNSADLIGLSSGTLAGMIIGAMFFALNGGFDLGVMALLAISMSGAGITAVSRMAYSGCTRRGFSKRSAMRIFLITILTGAGIGIGAVAGFLNPIVLGVLLLTGGPLIYSLLYQPIKQHRRISRYSRQPRRNLILP